MMIDYGRVAAMAVAMVWVGVALAASPIPGSTARMPDTTETAALTSSEAQPRHDVNDPDVPIGVSARAVMPFDPPPTPGDLRVTSTDQTSVTLSWDPAPSASGYRVYRRGVEVGSLNGAHLTTFTDDGLSPDCEYCYSVTAFGADMAESVGADLCTRTLGPARHCAGRMSLVDLGNHGNASDISYHGGRLVTADTYGLTLWESSRAGKPVTDRTWVYPWPYIKGLDVKAEVDDRGVAFELRRRVLTAVDLRDRLGGPRMLWRLEEVDDFAVEGTLLVVLSDSVRILDISDPVQPRLVCDDVEGIRHWPRSVCISRSLAAVRATGSFTEVFIVDLIEPTSPRVMSSVPIPAPPGPWPLWLVDDTLFVLGEPQSDRQLHAVDVSDPDNPVVHGTVDGLDEVVDLVAVGNTAYIARAGSVNEVVAYDLSSPGLPIRVDAAELPSAPTGIAAHDDRLYVVSKHHGIVVAELGDTLTVVVDGVQPGTAQALSIAGHLGVLANGDAGIITLDLSDPAVPVILGNVEVTGYAREVAVRDNLAYVAASTGGLQIVDLTSPESPSVLGGLEPYASAQSVAVADGIAVLGEGSKFRYGAVEIVDVGNPNNPVSLAVLRTGNSAPMGLALVGDIALVPRESWLLAINLADPEEPRVVSSLRLPATAYDVVVNGNLAYVALDNYFTAAVAVIDISEPATPRHVETVRYPAADDIEIAGTTVAVTFLGSIMGIGLADPAEPFNFAIDQFRWVRGTAFHQDLVYVVADPYLEVHSLVCRPPDASFEWRQSGTSVWFFDQSLNAPLDWLWDFGDGETSTERHPSHVFGAAGAYHVQLVATNASGMDMIMNTVIVAEHGARSPRRPTSRLP